MSVVRRHELLGRKLLLGKPRDMWRVHVGRRARKSLDRFPKRDAAAIVEALDAMEGDPLGGDVYMLETGSFRRRVRDYRIMFKLKPDIQSLEVTAIVRRTSTTYRRKY